MTTDIHEASTRGNNFPIKTFRDRDDWIKLLLAAEGDTLSAPARNVAVRIAFHHNVKTGQCNPSLAQIAAGSGMSDRNVRRMLREIEQAGWMVVNQSSGGRRSSKAYNSNSFELRVPLTRTDVSELNPDTVVRDKEPNPDKPGRLTRTSRDSNPDTVVRRKENLTANKNSEEERLSPGLDLGDKKEGRRERNPSSDSEIETKNHDAEFLEWWNQYPKKVAKSAALKAYRAVVSKKLARPAELMAGAMRYAAERSGGQDQKYTKHPATWLTGGCWADETATPIGNTIDADGNPIRPPPDRGQRSSSSWMDVAFAGLNHRGRS